MFYVTSFCYKKFVETFLFTKVTIFIDFLHRQWAKNRFLKHAIKFAGVWPKIANLDQKSFGQKISCRARQARHFSFSQLFYGVAVKKVILKCKKVTDLKNREIFALFQTFITFRKRISIIIFHHAKLSPENCASFSFFNLT